MINLSFYVRYILNIQGKVVSILAPRDDLHKTRSPAIYMNINFPNTTSYMAKKRTNKNALRTINI